MHIERFNKYHARVTDIADGKEPFDDRYVEFSGFFGKVGVDVYAAAPDLYDALVWLETYAEVQVRRHPDAEDNKGWRNILSALAKARGENAQD